MDRNKEYRLTLNHTYPIDISDIIGTIKFIDTPESNALLAALNEGNDITIKPYGYGERDENGNIKDFNLIGFTIV